jgi:hypothetical protein|tara:strand:+ start:12324 stop:12518 length:195 start_codon:yes stop_codon:yes gene_type:complete
MARSARADVDDDSFGVVNGDATDGGLCATSRCPRVGVDRPELLNERSFSTSRMTRDSARGRARV